MNDPELSARAEDEDGGALDRLHRQSRRFAGESRGFDVEQTLDAIRRRAASFWESLSLSEQQEFGVRSMERRFEAGVRLMVEGEAADHVLVILEGQAIISVRDQDGAERIIAERGPGELVGERALQQTGIRSATVVARTQVRVLSTKAEDFDEFLRTHPSVARPQPRPH